MRTISKLTIVLIALISFASDLRAEDVLQISRITPSGEDVPASQQIIFEFDQPVVPLGRMERSADEIPVSISPRVECEWRWISTSSLACQLTEKNALKKSTSYTIVMKPGITTQSGATLTGEHTHSFTTQRPKVSSYWFDRWKAPGLPQTIVVFDQAVVGSSARKHLYLQDSAGKRIPLQVKQVEKYEGLRWTVAPYDELPLASHFQIKVEPGVSPDEGEEKGIEDRVVAEFDTFPEFKFLGLRCQKVGDISIEVAPGDTLTLEEGCNPLDQVSLAFTAPIIRDGIKSGLLVTPDLAGGRTDFDPWESVYTYSSLRSAYDGKSEFTVPLPYYLKAAETYSIEGDGSKIQDEFGRNLVGGLSMKFMTNHRPAKYHLENKISALEKDVETHIPLIITNLKSIALNYEILTSKGLSKHRTTKLVPYDAQDVAYPYPLKVRDLLDASSGVFFGTVSAEASSGKTAVSWSGNQSFMTQVTPYSVHVKLGHFNSLLWVTKFSDGLPVKGAKVSAFVDTLGNFHDKPTVLGAGTTDENGIAILPGTDVLSPNLDLVNPWETEKPRLFFKVEQGSDLALVPLTYELMEYANDVSTYQRPKYGHMQAWGTTAQGIYRLGDTIQYKVYVRNQDNNTFIAPPLSSYTLQITDPTGNMISETKDIKLSEYGTYSSEFRIPKSGSVGWYNFQLKPSYSTESWTPLTVLVSDFTPSPFKVTAELNGQNFKVGDTVKVETFAKLHAGGPYADAGSRITATITGQSIEVKDPALQGFYFDTWGDEESRSFDSRQVYQEEDEVDSKGELSSEFALTDIDVLYGNLAVESAVRDDRGKYVVANASAKYFGRNRYIGLKQSEWLLTKDKTSTLEAVVIDDDLKLAGGTDINLKLEYRETKAARVKGPGNAFLVQYTSAWVNESETTIKSSEAGPVSWEIAPKNPGTYRLVASIVDTKGRAVSTTMNRWVVGSGEVLWDNGQSNTLKITAEKSEFHIGDTAKFLVQNPFPGALALVTTERFGVQKSWTTTLKSSTEVIEVPITADQVPGFYLSVVVTSPRVEKPLGENQVDLGKPAFRLGYVTVPVSDPAKELVIETKTDREVYKPRETVTLDLSVKARQGNAGDVEFAVAVLDQAVFDLIASGSKNFDPYKAFYNLESLDVQNYNLITQLIGRQKFEKKGASPGGDGGADLSMRSIFKFVSYWNPSLKADKNGKARVSFEVPDSLTGWRVLALAVNKKDLMGLGEGGFRVNRETEIRSALANQILEGDQLDAVFTVMNRTDKERKIDVQISADGPIESVTPVNVSLDAAPYKRYPVSIKIKALHEGKITFKAQAGDALDRDGLVQELSIHKRTALETAAIYGTTVEKSTKEQIEIPKDIRTDTGRISVVFSPSVITDVQGAFRYMRDYPYFCWEQRLTKGVMAAHFLALKDYLPKELTWEQAKSVVQQTLDDATSFQTPSGAMAYWVNTDEHADPYLSAYTALGFNWLSGRGYKISAEVQTKLDGYLLELLRKNAMPDFYTKGMASNVRAVALAALAPRGLITSADLMRYQDAVPEMSLFGKAQYLSALTVVGAQPEISKKVVEAILARGNETGGKFLFSEAFDASFGRILESSLRSNCAILSSLIEYEKKGGTTARDLPMRLVRAISQTRKSRDHWENTQENMFCMNALYDYSKAFETEKPQMKFAALLGEEKLGEGTFNSVQNEPLEIDRNINSSDPGRKTALELTKEGKGRLYYSARLFYAPLEIAAKPSFNGIEVRREYSVERDGTWEILKSPMSLAQGELVRVDLYLSLPSPRNFVAVNDPVPGGIEPVNRELATSSQVDANKAEFTAAGGSFWFSKDDWIGYEASFWSFYHQELRHDSVRYFADYLPAGNYHLSWVGQAIASGEFSILPTRAEEMYDPDVFGAWVPETLNVGKAD